MEDVYGKKKKNPEITKRYMIPSSYNRVHIDLHSLGLNYALLRKSGGKADLLAMVKADGYGHGMVECTKALQDRGCARFGVAELREAVLLRQSGVDSVIFAMIGFDNKDADLFCEYDLTPVVYDSGSLEVLSRAAVRSGKEISVHIKVDTGMRRLGVEQKELEELLQILGNLPQLTLGGIASHFPCADDALSSSTQNCLRKFAEYVDLVPTKNKIISHIANSGGTLYFPGSRYDMVRCGISLYGYYPEGRKGVAAEGLQPVMSFVTRVLQVKDVPAGSGVSYGHTYITQKPTRLAVLPVGYEDGYSRQLSNCGEVLIRGRRAKIRGRVCMNLCMVDVTEIDGVVPGDEAVLLGSQGSERITADEIASLIGTISYEVLCMIGNNNQREYSNRE